MGDAGTGASDGPRDTYWDEQARTYDADTAYAIGDEILTAMAAEIASEGDLGDVVEFGCGTGLFTLAYAHNASSVVATDVSEPMLDIARGRLAGLGNVFVRHADAADSGLPPEAYDTVVAVNLIHVVPDAGTVMREFARVVRPGGRVIVTSVNMHGVSLLGYAVTGLRALGRFGLGLVRRRRDPGPEELARLAKEAGLGVERYALLKTGRANALYLVGRKPAGKDG